MTTARFLWKTILCGFVVRSTGCGIYAGMPVEGSFDRTLAVNGPVDLEIFSGSGGIRIE